MLNLQPADNSIAPPVIHPSTNWRSQIEHAQKIGIGNMDYELVTVK